MLPLILTILVAPTPAEPGAVDVETPAPAPPASASPPDLGTIPEEILQIARSVSDRPLPERMGAISGALLGRPYVSDPLGEGSGVDPDPIARYDAFDCLTFTEEVLALSMAGDPAHAAQIRRDLRYGVGNPIDYVHRRHFMELQWIPGVVEDGFLRITTSEYGPVKVLDKEIDANTWRWWRPRSKFAHTDEQLPTGTMHLEVLDLPTAQAAADRIRPGSVILTVREDRPGVPLWVTHVSLVVPTGDGGTTMRHATKIGDGGTRDHDLAWYLEHLESYTNWEVAGIAVLEPIEPGPRRAVVPEP
ncbi:MAG TPA: DUF1460 domain-containing protein [Deltaproteobacteria bacterium]|nr:DUF1460 domain-containing protein [Deltaproteobacteria bacterium]